jgi:hypothetical protein
VLIFTSIFSIHYIYADKKKELVAERREALKKGNLELYGELQ